MTRDAPLPEWANPITIEDLKRLVRHCRSLMPDVGIQIPPNLSDWWTELVREGATDLGGLSANGDHISPEHPFPSPHQVRKRLKQEGYALTERLCVYPQYIEPDWIAQGVLDTIKSQLLVVHPAPRLGTPQRRRDRRRARAAARSRGRATGTRSAMHELTALFAERRPEVIEDMRLAADELRARLAGDTATFVVNRNINFTNVCQVGCAFCGFGQGRRSPDAYHATEDDFVGEGAARRSSSGSPRSACRAASIPTTRSSTTGAGCGSRRRPRRTCTCTPTPRWRCTTCASARAARREDVFEYLRECGLGSTPGTAAEVLHDGVRERISPNKLPVGPLGGDHRGLACAAACARR